ncbi:PH domain-containing protein [Klenkia soli]|uniref:PH domain-containing protein n=1 Tax=Klenkia soli TaxID=1052260 RepID=A0A1H0HCB3_9ACTN|nr:PH domain-containing protein [Klenkia soli]SDO16704.1 PH domain-containing protein [Klenkia soli]
MTRPRTSAPLGRDAGRYLLPGEKAVVNQRRHWAALVRPAVRGVPVLLAGVWVLAADPDNRFTVLLGLAIALGALGYLGLAAGEWWVRHFLVTKRRVLLSSGVFVRKVAVMPLRRITDLTYQETLVGQVLGYGGFRFESAGQDQALSQITYLPDAKKIYDDISGLLFPSDAGRGGGDDEEGGDPTRRPEPRTPAPAAPERHSTGPIPGFRSAYPRGRATRSS